MKFAHQKKKNVGLLYEFIVRHMAMQLIERDTSVGETFVMLKKFFTNGPLREELDRFNAIRNARGLSEASARLLVDEFKQSIRASDRRAIDERTSALVTEMVRCIGQDAFTRYRVPEYRLLASIQLLSQSTRAGSLSESAAYATVVDGLVRYMMSPSGPYDARVTNSDVDGIVVGLAFESYKKLYGDELSLGQRKLLSAYMRADLGGKQEAFLDAAKSSITENLELLKKGLSMGEVASDAVMKERLSEAIGGLERMQEEPRVDSSFLEELMLYERLAEELRSDE